MLLSKWCNREWCWQWFKWSVIVLWSVVSHDYLKLMIECIVRIHVSVLVFACRWRWCVWELLSLVETCTYICVVVAVVVWGVGWKKLRVHRVVDVVSLSLWQGLQKWSWWRLSLWTVQITGGCWWWCWRNILHLTYVFTRYLTVIVTWPCSVTEQWITPMCSV